MRIVAAVLTLLLLTTFPSTLADRLNTNDDCSDSVVPSDAGTACKRITLGSVPVVSGKTGNHLFLWLKAVDCAAAPVCPEARPPSENLATGMPAVLGVLYADTNGYPGLQTTHRTIGKFYWADDVVLV